MTGTIAILFAVLFFNIALLHLNAGDQARFLGSGLLGLICVGTAVVQVLA